MSPVKLDVPLPGVAFLADPEGVEVMTVATLWLVSPLVLSVTVLLLEVHLGGCLAEELVGVSALSSGVSAETEENKSDTDRVKPPLTGGSV